jgi:DNA-binding MarR family transcriptional regulator
MHLRRAAPGIRARNKPAFTTEETEPILVGKARPGGIGRVLPMEKSTINRNLEGMRKNGWIEVAAGDSGPARTAAVTPAGRKLPAALYPENNVVNLRMQSHE